MDKPKIIALIGPPACGKTLLSLSVVSKLKVQGKNAKLIEEFPRQYIERFGHPTHISEQMLIFLNWNRTLKQAVNIGYEYIVCDSPIFAAYVYGVSKANTKLAKDRLWVLELLDMALESVHEYDNIFYIRSGKDFPYHDNLRKSDRSTQKIIDNGIKGFLDLYKVGYTEVINEELKKSTSQIIDKIG